MSNAWKTIERIVAYVLEGVRSWETDHDVLVVIDPPGVPFSEPAVLMALHKAGSLKLASVEVKNLTAPTVAQIEGFLARNQFKIDRDIPGAVNALVIKRKAGRGIKTPFLFVMPLEVPTGD